MMVGKSRERRGGILQKLLLLHNLQTGNIFSTFEQDEALLHQMLQTRVDILPQVIIARLKKGIFDSFIR